MYVKLRFKEPFIPKKTKLTLSSFVFLIAKNYCIYIFVYYRFCKRTGSVKTFIFSKLSINVNEMRDQMEQCLLTLVTWYLLFTFSMWNGFYRTFVWLIRYCNSGAIVVLNKNDIYSVITDWKYVSCVQRLTFSSCVCPLPLNFRVSNLT